MQTLRASASFRFQGDKFACVGVRVGGRTGSGERVFAG